MTPLNLYPELPDIPYKKTSIGMPLVVAYAKSLIAEYSKDTVKMAYSIFRNECGNGLSGVNNNYSGIQADVKRWEGIPGTAIGTCVKIDNAGDIRRFLCFAPEDGYKISFELLCIKINQRGMKTTDDYFKKWVSNPKEDTKEARKDFNKLMKAAEIAFP